MKRQFTVIWSEFADRELTDIWLRAADGKSLARVIDDFAAALKEHPDAIAAEDQEWLRIATFPA